MGRATSYAAEVISLHLGNETRDLGTIKTLLRVVFNMIARRYQEEKRKQMEKMNQFESA